MQEQAMVPVTILTGFLGSGKTTLVNQLLKKERDSLVIVNEYGDVPVDHDLIEASTEKSIALPNGCLCCHVRGDLEEALMGAALRRRRGEIAGFDRVIVETSGLADPGPVAQTLYNDHALSRDYKLGPIVTVVDAADAGARQASADLLSDRLCIKLPEERDYATVAGFALSVLRHIPEVGERFSFGGWRFEIVDMDGRKIDKLLASEIPVRRRTRL